MARNLLTRVSGGAVWDCCVACCMGKVGHRGSLSPGRLLIPDPSAPLPERQEWLVFSEVGTSEQDSWPQEKQGWPVTPICQFPTSPLNPHVLSPYCLVCVGLSEGIKTQKSWRSRALGKAHGAPDTCRELSGLTLARL